MTDEQPEALRLADELDTPPVWESQPEVVEGWAFDSPLSEAASELRRLHEVNAELVEALRLCVPELERDDHHINAFGQHRKYYAMARAAIAKATGEQP